MSIDDKILRKPAERKCFCRGCDKCITRGDYIIYTHSFRNSGMSIIFCLDCAILIGDLAHGVAQ